MDGSETFKDKLVLSMFQLYETTTPRKIGLVSYKNLIIFYKPVINKLIRVPKRYLLEYKARPNTLVQS